MSGRDRAQSADGGVASGESGGGMSGANDRGQGPGHGGSSGSRTIRTAVWMVNAEGKAYRVPVRVLGSDLTSSAVQPLTSDALKEGDEVVTRVINPNSSSSSSSSNSRNSLTGFGSGGFGGGGGGGSGFSGMGGGSR